MSLHEQGIPSMRSAAVTSRARTMALAIERERTRCVCGCARGSHRKGRRCRVCGCHEYRRSEEVGRDG